MYRRTVDAVSTIERVGSGRPLPNLILDAMRLTGVYDTKQVLKIGDTKVNAFESLSFDISARHTVQLLRERMLRTRALLGPHCLMWACVTRRWT